MKSRNRPSFPETADIETSSEEYARRFSGEVGEWFLKIQEEVTLKMLAPYASANILDVGGGHGQLTSALIDNNFHTTILGSAEICKTRIENYLEDPRCSFKVGNILEMPFNDQEFEVVISYRLLAHVNKWKEFLAELTRVASQAVIIDYPELRSLNALTPYLFEYKKKIEGNTRQYNIFRESDLAKVFKSRGFIQASKSAEFFIPMVLHRKLNSPRFSSTIEDLSRSLGLTGVFGSPIILKLIRGDD